MKRAILLSLLFAVLAGGVQADWLQVGENPRLVTYVDTTIRTNQGSLFVWVLFDYKAVQESPRSGKRYLSEKAQYEIDRASEKARGIFFTWHSAGMGNGTVVHTGNKPLAWEPTSAPDSIASVLWKYVGGTSGNAAARGEGQPAIPEEDGETSATTQRRIYDSSEFMPEPPTSFEVNGYLKKIGCDARMAVILTFKDADGGTYSVPEAELPEFQKALPGAIRTHTYRDEAGKEYAVPEGEEAEFLKAVPAAKPALKLRMPNDEKIVVPIDEVYNFLNAYKSDPGASTERNLSAVEKLRKDAEQGDALAQYNLGCCYSGGHGVKKDPVEAVAWYRKAAEQGNDLAQFNLGQCYMNGIGVKKDPVQATYWLRKAAQQGNDFAQSRLGRCYAEGKGVTKNPVEAVRWFRKAAEQGNKLAHVSLGLHYVNGRGVIHDDVQACVHFLIARALGDEDASKQVSRLRNERLSDASYVTAQKQANDWMETFLADSKKGAPQTPESMTARREDKPRGTGSGFVISKDGYFLTCAHVIEGGREIKVRIGDKTHPAKVVRADSRNDVALLKLEGSDFLPLFLSQSIPDMGDKVFTVGFPNPEIQGASAKYTDGAISALSGILDDIRTMQVTVPIQGGNSGGALADAAGNIVGLVVAQLNAVTVFEYTGAIPQNVNFAVKINYAFPLIQAVPGLSSRLLQQAKAGASASPVKAVEAATGLVVVYE